MSGMNASGEGPFGECYPAFTSDLKCDVILGFRRALALVSMGCCVFVVFIIFVFKKYKFLPQRLILYLSISAFFQAIAYLMGDYHIAYKARTLHHLVGVCTFQGLYTLFFDWLSFLWVCFITFNIFYNALFLHKSSIKLEIVYIVLDITIPVIICCIPFIGHSYGPAGLWCWISSHNTDTGERYETGIAIQFAIFYGPLWFLCIVLVVLLMVTMCIIRHRSKKYQGTFNPQLDAQKKLWIEEIKPIMLFPWIYVIILIFPCMNRLRLAFGFDETASPGANFFFWFMHSITLTLHGAAYSLVFACDRRTMSRINYRDIKAAIMQRWGKAIVHEYNVEQSVGDDLEKQSYLPTKSTSNGHAISPVEMEDTSPSYTLYNIN